jgi:hypothetical protein
MPCKNQKTRKKTAKIKLGRLKVASKCLNCKERNCAFEDQSLRCGATKINLRTCALQHNVPTLGYWWRYLALHGSVLATYQEVPCSFKIRDIGQGHMYFNAEVGKSGYLTNIV